MFDTAEHIASSKFSRIYLYFDFTAVCVNTLYKMAEICIRSFLKLLEILWSFQANFYLIEKNKTQSSR